MREGKYRRKETKTDTAIKGLIRFLQFGFLLGDLGVGEWKPTGCCFSFPFSGKQTKLWNHWRRPQAANSTEQWKRVESKEYTLCQARRSIIWVILSTQTLQRVNKSRNNVTSTLLCIYFLSTIDSDDYIYREQKLTIQQERRKGPSTARCLSYSVLFYVIMWLQLCKRGLYTHVWICPC